MTTVQGMSDDLIIITHNGKEIEFTPIYPREKTRICFSDESAIEIYCNYHNIWVITPFVRGHIEAELYICSCYDNSDLYRTMADPVAIKYSSMNGVKKIIELNKEV